MNDILNNISADDIEKFKLFTMLLQGSSNEPLISLGNFADEYCKYAGTNLSKSYHRSVIISFNHLMKFFPKQFPIKNIDLKSAENFITQLQKKCNKGVYVYYRNLKSAFNKAVAWGYLKENVFVKVKLKKKQSIKPVFISKSDLNEICKFIEKPTIREICYTSFYTGMRLNEIINLKWTNVDMIKKVITVGDDEFTTKGRKQRFIPICDDLFVLLINRITTRNIIQLNKSFVFEKIRGVGYSGDYVSKQFKAACREGGFDEKIHFHSLRHSFASALVQSGVSLYAVKDLLGHTSISTTEIYSHLDLNTLRKAVEVLG